MSLNLIGYLVGMSSRLITDDRKEVITFLFTVSKKEFSIAAAFAAASGLPAEIAISDAFFAVIQMITSPIAAKILARGWRDEEKLSSFSCSWLTPFHILLPL